MLTDAEIAELKEKVRAADKRGAWRDEIADALAAGHRLHDALLEERRAVELLLTALENAALMPNLCLISGHNAISDGLRLLAQRRPERWTLAADYKPTVILRPTAPPTPGDG